MNDFDILQCFILGSLCDDSLRDIVNHIADERERTGGTWERLEAFSYTGNLAIRGWIIEELYLYSDIERAEMLRDILKNNLIPTACYDNNHNFGLYCNY